MDRVPDTELTGTSDWKPAPWLAAVLSLLSTPLGLLYVQRPWLAAGYLVAGLIAAAASIAVDVGVRLGAAVRDAGGRTARGHRHVCRAFVSCGTSPGAYRATCLVLALVRASGFPRAGAHDRFSRPIVSVRAVPDSSASMHPTIPAGSYVIVSKAGSGQYGTFGVQPWRRPATAVIARGDIVVHRSSADPSVMHVARVVGLPGDHVRYLDRQLTHQWGAGAGADRA